jgi:hypothetical protein
MAFTLSTGTAVAVAKTYGSAVNMTAITNAAEAVATLAAGHGVVVGDYLELTSGWGRLNGRIVRAKTVVTNDVTLEGINTVSTTLYPAGTGTGTIRRITAWDSVNQIKELSLSGGDQQFADITTLDDVVAKQIPTIRNAQALSIQAFDDPTLAYYNTVVAYAEQSTQAAVRLSFPNGSKIVANGYWSVKKVPEVARNEALVTTLDMSIVSEPTRYAT